MKLPAGALVTGLPELESSGVTQVQRTAWRWIRGTWGFEQLLLLLFDNTHILQGLLNRAMRDALLWRPAVLRCDLRCSRAAGPECRISCGIQLFASGLAFYF
jgi:hypothetical protein